MLFVLSCEGTSQIEVPTDKFNGTAFRTPLTKKDGISGP